MKTSDLLFNPFPLLGPRRALGLGLVLLLLGAAAAAVLELRFDGVIDLHLSVVEEVGPLQALADLLIDAGAMIAVLWIAARVTGPGRPDLAALAGYQLVARWPLYVAGMLMGMLPGVGGLIERLATTPPDQMAGSLSGGDAALIMGVSVISLIGVIWAVLLMYRGYRAGGGVEGRRAVWSFVVALIAAEFLSKSLIYALPALWMS